jgi:translation initiation factor IF-3
MLRSNNLLTFIWILLEDSAIARRRFIRPQETSRKSPRINDRIRAKTVRLIDQDENMIGLVPITDAIERARSADLDLVEVSPGSDPPVCRILDFGKYKYELSKKERANRAKTKVVETKEVRLGRSMKIDPHDIAIRLNQARKFLLDGHKVLIVQNFRGREMMHKDRGHQRMREIIETLSDIAKVELAPRMAGRRQTMVLAPDKIKIQKILAAKKAQDEKNSQQESND